MGKCPKSISTALRNVEQIFETVNRGVIGGDKAHMSVGKKNPQEKRTRTKIQIFKIHITFFRVAYARK